MNKIVLTPDKRYYTIGEVAKMFEVNSSLLRFWEKEFDVLQPKKNRKGNRLFTPKDIENLKIIYHLVKERGYTLEGAKKKLKQNRDETVNTAALTDKLNHIKSELIKLREALRQ